MPRKATRKPDAGSANTATIGFEAKLWLAADFLTGGLCRHTQLDSGESAWAWIWRASGATPPRHAAAEALERRVDDE
jgi:hypothetical protein